MHVLANTARLLELSPPLQMRDGILILYIVYMAWSTLGLYHGINAENYDISYNSCIETTKILCGQLSCKLYIEYNFLEHKVTCN